MSNKKESHVRILTEDFEEIRDDLSGCSDLLSSVRGDIRSGANDYPEDALRLINHKLVEIERECRKAMYREPIKDQFDHETYFNPDGS